MGSVREWLAMLFRPGFRAKATRIEHVEPNLVRDALVENDRRATDFFAVAKSKTDGAGGAGGHA